MYNVFKLLSRYINQCCFYSRNTQVFKVTLIVCSGRLVRGVMSFIAWICKEDLVLMRQFCLV